MMLAQFEGKNNEFDNTTGQNTDVSTEFPNIVVRLKKKLLEINASVRDDAPEWQ
jgi:hypothetical protein